MKNLFAKILWIAGYPFQVFFRKEKEKKKEEERRFIELQEKRNALENKDSSFDVSLQNEKEEEKEFTIEANSQKKMPSSLKSVEPLQTTPSPVVKKQAEKEQIEPVTPSILMNEKKDTKLEEGSVIGKQSDDSKNKGAMPQEEALSSLAKMSLAALSAMGSLGIVKEKTKSLEFEKTTLKEEEVETLQKRELKEKVEEGLASVIDERRKVLNELIISYNEVHKAFDKAEEQKEVVALLEEVQLILIKLEALQNEIEMLREKGDIKAISDLEGVMLKELGKIQSFSTETVIAFVEEDVTYNRIVSKISELDEKREGLEQDLEKKKELIEKRDEKFQEMDEATDKAVLFEERLYKSCVEIDILARDLEEKAEAQIEVTEKIKYKFDFATKASSMLLAYMALAKKSKGPSSVGMSLLAGMLALKVGKDLIMGKKDISYVKSYTDYSKEIENALSSVGDLKSLLKKGIEDVKELEKEFEEQFKDYLPINKEYQKVLNSIQTVKENLEEKEEFLIEQENSLNRSAAITKAKVHQLKR